MGLSTAVRLSANPSRVTRLALAGLLISLVLPIGRAAAEKPVDGVLIGRIAAEDVLLRSRAGKTLAPPPELLLMLAGDEDTALWALPSDASLIEVLYSRALGGDRWDLASYDDSFSAAGQATAALAGLRLAELLDDMGGREAARARLYATGVKAQADYALVNLVGVDAAAMATTETWLLLHAMAELAHATSSAGPAAIQDDLFHTWFVEGAHELHRLATDAPPEDLAEASIAASALSAYSLVAENPAEVARQLEVIAELAEAPTSTVDAARTIRLFLAATRASGNGDYAARAGALLDDVVANLDTSTSYLEGVETLTIWELADVLGALGDAYEAGLGDPRAEIGHILHYLVLDSGLMGAVPTPGNPFYPHFGAGEPFPSDERIWTFASSIAYDDVTGWSVTDRTIDLPGALYAAAEMMSLPAVQPVVDSAPDPTGIRAVTVESTEFAFSPDTISLTEGEEITLKLVNSGAVEHNIDIPSLGILLTAAPGEIAETSLVVPDPGQSGDFYCSLPGHTESGMIGTMSINVAPSESVQDDQPAAIALPELDEASGSPTFETAVIISLGFFLGMMVLVVGMLQFMKGFERQA